MSPYSESISVVKTSKFFEVVSLSNLKSCLRDLFRKGQSSQLLMQRAAAELKNFGRPGVLALVAEILNNEELLISVASQSYLHKNGFLKILLLKEQDFRVRLHIWMPETDSKETLHNHCWYLASTIVNGKLTSEIWQDSISENSDFFDEYLYRGKFVAPVLMGKARVELLGVNTRSAGEAYVLEPHVLHKIVSNEGQMAATLICRSNDVRVWSRNIILNEKIPDVKPHYLSPEQLKNYLNRYLLLDAEERKAALIH
jgi:hypothetical protein